MAAATMGNSMILETLIEVGADLDDVDDYGNT